VTQRYDVAIVGDFRFPGGTSTAVAAEIEAQARAGYRTALLALKAPVLKFPHRIHPQIRAHLEAGRADLVDPETPIEAGLALVHHPQVLTHLPRARFRLAAEHRLLVAHHPPYDAEGRPFYDWSEVERNAAALFGRPVPWAPVGPAVRRQLRSLPGGPALWLEDWSNVLDPAAWTTAPRPFAGEIPVIGRHSRPDLLKWPATRDEVLLVYPGTADVRVRALGGDPTIARFLAPLPPNWELLPFDTVGVREFLAGLDVYVFYHHPRWVEAFGRTLIEAMAAGLPVVLPEHFRELFGEAALYAEPCEAAATVRRLRAEPEVARAQGERARAAVEERFSLRQHAARVEALLGRARSPAPSRAAKRRVRTALFFTSNGIGLGHLTRTLAIAKRCPPGIEPVFVTLSQGARLLEEAGFTTEYLPFHAYLGAEVNRWNHHLAAELGEMARFYDPAVILFDGNTPYSGLVRTIEAASRAWSVWVRRGFWRPGTGTAALERERTFDAVVEPEDLADILDQGPTTRHRGRTLRVPPIRLLDRADLLPRAAARRELGLPGTGTCVLLQLGAGNNFDFAAVQERIVAHLSATAGVTLAALESPISHDAPGMPEAVRLLRAFPASRYIHAFDFVVSAAGYNSYHELLLSATPALFVPNEHPMMDDQRARADHADRMGWSLSLRAADIYRVAEQVARLLDPDEREAMRRRMEPLPQGNGAAEAAAIVAEMAFTARADCPG
jgi:hypothetical protein